MAFCVFNSRDSKFFKPKKIRKSSHRHIWYPNKYTSLKIQMAILDVGFRALTFRKISIKPIFTFLPICEFCFAFADKKPEIPKSESFVCLSYQHCSQKKTDTHTHTEYAQQTKFNNCLRKIESISTQQNQRPVAIIEIRSFISFVLGERERISFWLMCRPSKQTKALPASAHPAHPYRPIAI